MRIIFVGVVKNSRHCLQEIIKNGGNVVGIVTLARQYAGGHSDYADLSGIARHHRMPLHLTRDINEQSMIELLRSLCPDIIFIFGWSQIVRKQILDIPKFGCIGVHLTLLPEHRGRHPIIWALVEGLTESGVTFFYLDEGMDSGDILWQKSFPISLEDNAASVYEKVMALESEAIREFLPQLEAGNAPRVPQDHSEATYWRKRTEEDGLINWATEDRTIYNLIRGLTRPYVGAYTFCKSKKFRVWKAAFAPLDFNFKPRVKFGTIVGMGPHGIDVKTGNGCITIRDYDFDSTLEVGDWLG